MRNLVVLVLRVVGLPDVLVSDRDTRWKGLHAAQGASLTLGSQHHHNTTCWVERVNGVIADVLSARAPTSPRAAGRVRGQRFAVARVSRDRRRCQGLSGPALLPRARQRRIRNRIKARSVTRRFATSAQDFGASGGDTW